MNPTELTAVYHLLLQLAEEAKKQPYLDDKHISDLRLTITGSPYQDQAINASGFSQHTGEFMLENGKTPEQALQKLRERLAHERLPKTIPA